jgi:hypothetical protein
MARAATGTDGCLQQKTELLRRKQVTTSRPLSGVTLHAKHSSRRRCNSFRLPPYMCRKKSVVCICRWVDGTGNGVGAAKELNTKACAQLSMHECRWAGQGEGKQEPCDPRRCRQTQHTVSSIARRAPSTGAVAGPPPCEPAACGGVRQDACLNKTIPTHKHLSTLLTGGTLRTQRRSRVRSRRK